MIEYQNEWYFWHEHYPEYAERMQVMAEYARSYFTKYVVDNLLSLVPKT